ALQRDEHAVGLVAVKTGPGGSRADEVVLDRVAAGPGDDDTVAPVEDAVGDLITEDLARILVSVYDGNPQPLKALVENEKADEYVRSAVLEAFALLVALGKHPREEVVTYFRELLSGKLKRDDSFIWTGLILACLDLHPSGLMKEIRKAYALEL
ncbi:MAG: DUF1186 domain-containing protein, partial [Verrucomicrobiota bacterium]